MQAWNYLSFRDVFCMTAPEFVTAEYANACQKLQESFSGRRLLPKGRCAPVDIDDCAGQPGDSDSMAGAGSVRPLPQNSMLTNHLSQNRFLVLTGMFETLFTLLGIALCAVAVLQMGLWSAQSLMQIRFNRKQYELARGAMREQINSIVNGKPAGRLPEGETAGDGTWQGFRPFVVDRMVRETETVNSVYLKPEDGKAFPEFLPGQHLTFQFDIPGQAKPVIRCYSLSDSPSTDYYRISVKKSLPPRDKPELPSGRASTYVNESLMTGERLRIKSPSGSFFLDEQSAAPVVLLAGGIGITPMISMLNQLIDSGSKRMVVLIYGSRHSQDHAFKEHLSQTVQAHKNIHVVNVYSSPLETDATGRDYDVSGFISIDLIRNLLPNNQFQFYMCGPPPFMDSVYNGLIEWGVPDSRISFEAFGPASIGRKKRQTGTAGVNDATPIDVKFAQSGATASWDGTQDNLLELAEANGIAIDSGCRAGSCGTCETGIVSGKVEYPDGEIVNCLPGTCLVCLARPSSDSSDGELELEA